MNKAIFTDEANQDLLEAVNWYEKQQKGIGKKLANEVIIKIKKLEIKPDSFSSDETGLRRASLKSFPYFIYYLHRMPIVLIVAVWHKSRLKNVVEKRVVKLTEPDEN
ncbi:MAG: type II toxin-antitoxin system RelE/ParE family toxin [Leptospiraceae bacterium]|nr:type II toxin-antitoxin system RelE/ParE family toxin [Leptospiraceae bacterium]